MIRKPDGPSKAAVHWPWAPRWLPLYLQWRLAVRRRRRSSKPTKLREVRGEGAAGRYFPRPRRHSTRASRRPWTRRSRVTGSSWLPATTTRAPTSRSRPTSFEHGDFGGVYITKPNLHVRGMNRAGVVVDGTKPGSAQCSAIPSAQQFGAKDADGKAAGRNGILVWKANSVSVENLTVCNFLGGNDESGNEVWWNGGAETGEIGLHGYTGRYLTATSTYFGEEETAAQYGIFSSNSQGPGALGSAVRQQLQRLRHVRRRLPAGLRRDHQPCLDAVQRPRLLGDQLRRAPSSSRTRSSTTTRTASTPTRRSTVTRRHRRTAPARTTASARSRTPIPAGCSCTTTCMTTTTPTSPRQERGPVRSVPA